MTKKRRQQSFKTALTTVTLVALGALIYTVRAQIADTITNLGEVNRYALLLMLVAQTLNYHSYTKMYQYMLRILDHKISYRRMLRIVSELNFVNNVFPSGGVSGFSYFGMRMRARGANTGTATFVQMMRFILIFISFQILLGTGLIILAIDGGVNNLVMLIAGGISTLMVVGSLFAVYIIGSKQRIKSFSLTITKIVNRFIQTVRPKSPETISLDGVEKAMGDLHDNYQIFKSDWGLLLKPLAYGLLANIAEITTIYVVYIAFGYWPNPGAIILAYSIANFAGLVSVLPGGVGIYEGLMTAVLATAGVPAGVSLPVTIMYRVLNMTIQLPPGYYFYHNTVVNNKLVKKPKGAPVRG
ncbi:MAG: flippase-like domain-containing protein [bacterium]|nr:flippase-like domain-containing protein [bacterium]